MDRVAFITGASSGIGKEVALELARRKYKVALVARREKELLEVAAAARATGAEASIHVTDVAERASVEAAARACEERFGRVDLLVASAGIGMPREKGVLFDSGAVEKTLRVNLLGVVYAIGAVLPGMLARGAGHVSAISSLAAYRGLPRSHAYTASKAGVNGLLEGLRIDVARKGVAVTIVNPGFVDTPLTADNKVKMPFLVQAPRAARIIVDGLERRKRVIEFPFPLVALTKLSRTFIPDWIYERIVARRG